MITPDPVHAGFAEFLKTRKPYEEVHFTPIPKSPFWDRSEAQMFPLAILPIIGIPITIYKEIQIAKKLKNGSSVQLLQLQKAHRAAAIARTLLTVVIAVTLLSLALLFGNIPFVLGLGLIGGAFACGAIFAGIYGGLLHSSNKKLKS